MPPDRLRASDVAELLRYLGDYHGVSQTELARRLGVGRERVSRWATGRAEPTLGKLRSLLEPLGWLPVISLLPTEAVLAESLIEPVDLNVLLGWSVIDLLVTVAVATERGLDATVGGEVAAVLQGAPLRTRHLVVHLREGQRPEFTKVASERRQSVGHWMHDPDKVEMVISGSVGAPLRVALNRPPMRLVYPDHSSFAGRPVPVVTLAELRAKGGDERDGLGPAALRVLDKLIERAG